MKKKKLLSFFVAAALSLSCFSAVPIVSQAADEVESVPVYGLYNPNSGEHLFTISVDEVRDLFSAGWRDGNVKWKAPKEGALVYRLYNPNVFASDGTPLGDHHYTSNYDEVENLLAVGWLYDGPAFYSSINTASDIIPIYGLYNPNAYAMGMSGAHHFTMNEDEKTYLLSLGWKEGDPKFYGYTTLEKGVIPDILPNGIYEPDPDCTGYISDDMSMLTITTGWGDVYEKKEYHIPIKKECTVAEPSYPPVSDPLSRSIDTVQACLGKKPMRSISIYIDDGKIFNFYIYNFYVEDN